MQKQTMRQKVKDRSLPAKFRNQKANRKQHSGGEKGEQKDAGHVGIRGKDARLVQNEATLNKELDNLSPGAISQLQVRVDVTDKTIAILAMGIVLKGIKSGSLAAQKQNEQPYYQWRYLIEVITSTMQSGVMILTNAPRWMWELLHLIKPKSGYCKNARVNYSWNIINTGLQYDQEFVLAAYPPGSTYNLWWGTGGALGDINGFPILQPSAPYTTALGAESISALYPYITQNVANDVIGDPGPDGVSTHKDTSAFAVVYPEIGGTDNAQGGLRTTIYSERHIDSPLVAQFGVYQEQGSSSWRGWTQAAVGSGSPCMIGPVMSKLKNIKQIRNKTATVIKYYNFDEFFTQLSYTLAEALNRKLEDTTQTHTPCPLPAHIVQILLRQTILQHTNNEMVQDVQFSGPGRAPMTPCVVGPAGTPASTGASMLLPTFLAENIRAISSLTIGLSKKYGQTLTWIPVLARPINRECPQSFDYNGGGVYTGSTTAISLIDASAFVGPNKVYVDFTRTAFQAYITTWNEWITSLTDVMSPLVTPGSEKGITAMNANLYTNSQDNLGITVLQGRQPPAPTAKKVVHLGFDVSTLMTSSTVKSDSYFPSVGERAITANSSFDKRLDQVIDNMILPVSVADDLVNSASSQGYQVFQMELSSKPRSTAGGVYGPVEQNADVPNVDQRLRRAALIDVKARGTANQQNEIIGTLVELAKEGRGGFLKAALTGLANAFLPGAGDFVGELLD
jgi:hypothetical protein